MATVTRAGMIMLLLATPAGLLAQDPPAEQAQRRILNGDQAAIAAGQVAQIEARKKAIEAQHAADQLAYEQALAQRAAQIARDEAQAARDRAAWEAAVASCEAGNRSQCAQSSALE